MQAQLPMASLGLLLLLASAAPADNGIAIRDAVEARDLGTNAALLRAYPDLIHAYGRDGQPTTLHQAVFLGYRDVAELLLAHGAELDIFTASALSRTDRIEAWLRATPSLARERTSRGLTPLHYAARGGAIAVARLLIAHGAEMHADDWAQTPLHHAAKAGQARMVDWLIASGADAGARDSEGSTPLHLAAEAGRHDAAKVLIARKADMNARDRNGLTPLHRTIKYGNAIEPGDESFLPWWCYGFNPRFTRRAPTLVVAKLLIAHKAED